MKLNRYYYELPKNFEEVYQIDAKSKKTATLFNLFSIVVFIIVMLITYLIISLFKEITFKLNIKDLLIFYLLFIGCSIGYIVLHELTHGIVYYLLTKQKLTFGLTLSVAFCGVPNIYVNKKTALSSMLAPFLVFLVVYISLLILVNQSIYLLLIIILFSLHISGCIGDLYGSYILIFKIKKDCLMNDTGPKQTFYIKK